MLRSPDHRNSLQPGVLHPVQHLASILCWLGVCLALLSHPGQVAAAHPPQQTGLTVQRDEIVLDFPTGLTFHLEASAPSPVAKLFLNYRANSRGCLDGYSRQTIDLSPGTQITASWEWDFTQSGSLPPGAEITWEWEVVLANGDTLRTERQVYTLEDPRFAWQRLEKDRVTVVWTVGQAAFGRQILSLAQSSLEYLETDLGITSQDSIRLTIYPSSADLKGAFLYLSDWVGGLALPEFNNLIIGIPPDELAWAEEVISHEIAHLVVGMRTANCLGISLPTWLSEGLSVAAEGEQSPEDRQLLLDRLESDDLPGLVTLSAGFSAHSEAARLSYMQSGAVILYLTATYGPEKLDQLLSTIQSGKNANPALLEVYGLDTAGIDQAWRASLGFGEAPVQQAATATLPPTEIPTLALYTAAVASSPTPSPSPSPTRSPSATPQPPTPTASAASLPSEPGPTPASAGSPLRCLNGALLSCLAPLGLWLYLALYRRTAS